MGMYKKSKFFELSKDHLEWKYRGLLSVFVKYNYIYYMIHMKWIIFDIKIKAGYLDVHWMNEMDDELTSKFPKTTVSN